MARRYVDNSYNRSLGRVGMAHGSCVVSSTGSGGGSRSSSAGSYGSRSAASTTSGTSPGCYVDNAYNRSLGRVGKAHGTCIVNKTGSGSGSAASTASTNGQGCYVDNPTNRALGRVGKPRGTHVVSKSGEMTVTGEIVSGPGSAQGSTSSSASNGKRVYVDNAYNRRLGRVGKPLGSCVVKKEPKKDHRRELLSENTSQGLVEALQVLGLQDPNRPRYQYAVDAMEREMIEEEWRTSGLEPMTDTSCLSDHNPGEIIPYSELEFRDKKPIGRGGFGEVYAGTWHGTPIAFKKLLYQQMSRKIHNSFTKEVSILAKLDHPNTVKMFGAVVESGHVGIVMEYMHRSLQKALHWDEVSFSNPKKKSLVNQMANALEYLHHGCDKQIAHCDIKPDNILLDKYDNAKLSDFGISAIKNATETSQSSVAGAAAPPGQGTPRYSAPEVLRGEILKMSELLKTDIYSLAVVVFELLTEEEPYLSLNRRQLEVHVGNGSVRPTSDDVIFSRPVAELLKRCWDAKATARPTAIEFRQAWIKVDILFS